MSFTVYVPRRGARDSRDGGWQRLGPQAGPCGCYKAVSVVVMVVTVVLVSISLCLFLNTCESKATHVS